MPEWRCFQCDEVLTDEKAALAHFGRSTLVVPLCCDRSLATYQDAIQQLRQAEDHAQTLYRLKTKAETEVERMRALFKELRSAWFKGADLDKDHISQEALRIFIEAERTYG